MRNRGSSQTLSDKLVEILKRHGVTKGQFKDVTGWTLAEFIANNPRWTPPQFEKLVRDMTEVK